jgi:ABC-type lipoprotein export system ATPase subunit
MVVCENLVKIYKALDIEVVALQGLDLVVEDGELMAVIGNSGSGKSSLLNILGGIDRPSAGTVHVGGDNILAYDEHSLRTYRRQTVGFIWQNSARNLIPYLSALENVELPMRLSGKPDRARAKELLDMVGLAQRHGNTLSALSGGEQQRVAIAIGLANKPRLLLADEPTGSVDSATTSLIMELFKRVNRDLGTTIIIVTHDTELARSVDRVVAIRDGRTSSEFLRKRSYLEEMKELSGDGFGEEAADAGAASAGAAASAGEAAISGDAASGQGGQDAGGPPRDDTHEELVVMDGVGRIQLPEACVKALGLQRNSKLRVSLEDGRIVIGSREKKGTEKE